MNEKILGRSKRKKHWGRYMLVDNWQKLKEVIELIKSSLPLHIELHINESCGADRDCEPLPFDPSTKTAIAFPMPALAEVRVSLLVDEKLGWKMPLHFCVGPLLTAAEIIQKVTDACFFLQAWSHGHLPEARARLRSEHRRTPDPMRSRRKPLVQ